MNQVFYNPAKRKVEKARQRAYDALQLHRGEISRHELRKRNAFLAPLEIVDSSIRCQEAFD
ncbi:hypothetical protein WG901_13120 [Novosphingobium sp. PS1R-30]|uniref:Integrase n=1 Tax=Novosphingobium anseongense TaxID=3133436 RepID=A0ABU8RXZ4_9SPHN